VEDGLKSSDKIIKDNPNITTTEMANTIGISEKGVEYQLNKLKRENLIKREGSKKSGKWIIIN